MCGLPNKSINQRKQYSKTCIPTWTQKTNKQTRKTERTKQYKNVKKKTKTEKQEQLLVPVFTGQLIQTAQSPLVIIFDQTLGQFPRFRLRQQYLSSQNKSGFVP